MKVGTAIGAGRLALCAAVLLAGCGGGASAVPGASVARGHALIVHDGCGACHQIGGVAGADGRVGPSLRALASERVVGGTLPNSPPNLASWIAHPQRFDRSSVMPDLGIAQRDALDMVAYLYSQ